MPHSPRWKKLGLRLLLCLGVAGLAAPGRPRAVVAPVGPYFNGTFPRDSPGAAPTWMAVNAFPMLGFTDPLWITEIPGTADMLVVEKGGKLKRFRNDPQAAQVEVILDLGPRLQVSEDQGLYQVAFHPDFGKAGAAHAQELFVTYSHRPAAAGAEADKSLWRLSRFRWDPGSGAIDPAGEEVLIQQYDPNRWHNGGAMAFDESGCLLLSCGDGGGNDDQFGQAQALDGGFFGGIFRIDVDADATRSHAIRRQPAELPGKPAGFPESYSQGYMVPNDNPWQDDSGGLLEEAWAIGLRSPHTAHYDAEKRGLWVGDVGRKDREELDLVTAGANLQWPFMEGDIAGPKPRVSEIPGKETPPVYAYDRRAGGCIIGGMRYRGAKWASSFGGKVIFGDNLKGTLVALDPTPGEGPPQARELLSGFGDGSYAGLSNICTDSSGEIYLLKLNGRGRDGGSVHKLVPGQPYPDPPALLSATGLFKDTARLIPVPALRPYELASPAWFDGAEARRWIALPNDGQRDSAEEKIGWSASGNWSFPAGTVFVQHLEMATDARHPESVKRFETRVIVCTANGGKYGLSYRWNDAGTDAVLLKQGETEAYTLVHEDGRREERQWTYPSRADCMQCHTNAAGQALGLRTHQLNREVMIPGVKGPVNQLERFNREAVFEPALTEGDLSNALAARSLDDEAAPLEHRIRSYFDANCAHCHQPGGIVPYFDARLQTPFREQGLLDAPLKGQYQLADGRYLKPDNAVRSAIRVRLASAAPGIAMPPLGRHSVDHRALALLDDYIASFGPRVSNDEAEAIRCSIAAPREVAGSEFPVTIVFDAAVSGVDISDIQVVGGKVKSLRGGGYYYVATVDAASPDLTIQIRPDAASEGSFASNRIRIQVRRPAFSGG